MMVIIFLFICGLQSDLIIHPNIANGGTVIAPNFDHANMSLSTYLFDINRLVSSLLIMVLNAVDCILERSVFDLDVNPLG